MARQLAEVVVVVFEETSATGAAAAGAGKRAEHHERGGNDQRLSKRASRSIPSHPSVHVVRVPRPLSLPLRSARYRANVIRR